MTFQRYEDDEKIIKFIDNQKTKKNKKKIQYNKRRLTLQLNLTSVQHMGNNRYDMKLSLSYRYLGVMLTAEIYRIVLLDHYQGHNDL